MEAIMSDQNNQVVAKANSQVATVEERRAQFRNLAKDIDTELAVRLRAAESGGPTVRAFEIATLIVDFRERLKPFGPVLKGIAGNSTFFKTDKDDKGEGEKYPESVIVRVCADALARGLRWNGDEFMIYRGELYIKKNGYARLIAEYRGVTDFTYSVDPPTTNENGRMFCMGHAEWKQDGVFVSRSWPIPVKANARDGGGDSRLMGTAKRGLLEMVYTSLCGSVVSIDDDDDTPISAPISVRQTQAILGGEQSNQQIVDAIR
jgi:hypothetical protein